MKRLLRHLRRAVCLVLGHDPVRLCIGPNYIEACLRCHAKLDIHEEARDG